VSIVARLYSPVGRLRVFMVVVVVVAVCGGNG
jgi:hypothetical protein